MKLEPNQELGGYRIVRPLGAGGMGAVYEVEHLRLGTHYALKVHAVSGAHSDFFRRRFAVEGKILSRLNHPGLVRVIDLDYDERRGVLYYVMDLVLDEEGAAHTLEDFEPGSVGEDRLLAWFRELCDVIAYVHEQGIVHRDIKLANILLRPDGHVVLSDFGISKVCDEGLRSAVDVTKTIPLGGAGSSGMIFGTRDYVAPEVARGEDATNASDVYSLGVTFFKLLTNVWYDPCLAPSADKDSGTTINAMKLLEHFKLRWGDVLLPMLDEDPANRPLDLRALPERVCPHRKSSQGRWGLRAVVSCLFVAGLAAVAFLVWHSRRDVPVFASADVPVRTSDVCVAKAPVAHPAAEDEDAESCVVEQIVNFRYHVRGTCDSTGEATELAYALDGEHGEFSFENMRLSDDRRSFEGEMVVEGCRGHPPDAVRAITEYLSRKKLDDAVRKWSVRRLR